MRKLTEICAGDDGLLLATAHRLVGPADLESRREAIEWWTALTERGGEGMVVKPYSFIAEGRRGPLQPALKCRGREYLRTIYGPLGRFPDPPDNSLFRDLSSPFGRKTCLFR